MNASGLRIIKVGGSLFEYPYLANALTEWLAQQSPMQNLIVTGGGVWADEIRVLETSGRLSVEAAHWLAIRAMKLTAWLLCQMLPGATIADQLDCLDDPGGHLTNGRAGRLPNDNCDRFRLGGSLALPNNSRETASRQPSAVRVAPIVFDPEQFLQQVEPNLPPMALPIGWQVTSDSIAARIAETLDADELVLMKSTDPPTSTIEQAAQDGLVDAHFPLAAASVRRLRWVNLRRQLKSSA